MLLDYLSRAVKKGWLVILLVVETLAWINADVMVERGWPRIPDYVWILAIVLTLHGLQVALWRDKELERQKWEGAYRHAIAITDGERARIESILVLAGKLTGALSHSSVSVDEVFAGDLFNFFKESRGFRHHARVHDALGILSALMATALVSASPEIEEQLSREYEIAFGQSIERFRGRSSEERAVLPKVLSDAFDELASACAALTSPEPDAHLASAE